MSQVTIRCRLIAPEDTRKMLWQLMAERNTPLINAALKQLPQHPDFAKWQRKGKVPDTAVKQIINSLKVDPQFMDQPAWYYISAQKHVTYIFRSWLALKQRKQWKLEGKRRWLEVLKADITLAELAHCSLEDLQQEAQNILTQVVKTDLVPTLWHEYAKSEQTQRKCAIAYLLKRSGKLEPKEEDLKQLEKRRNKTKIFIQRLTDQIENSLPKGRDLTDSMRMSALTEGAQSSFLEDAEYNAWRDVLTTEPATFPFPIIYETAETLIWSRDEKNRILVRFSGSGPHTFKVYCDKPHYHWFELFLTDQQVKKAGSDQHSAGLFTLRSAGLGWVLSKKHQTEQHPWNRFYLNLTCTVDTRLWTQEGTQTVSREKAAKTAKAAQAMQAKASLIKTQQGYLRRLESNLQRLQASYPRPSRPLYQGQDEILVGISMGLDKPATLAVVNVLTGETLAYRSIKQLLGDQYPLLQRARQEKAKVAHEGHRQRRKGGRRLSQESNLGKQIDRILAKQIVAIAQQYQASSIVLPNLNHIRDAIEAEVSQRAQAKVPDFVEGQRQYAKAYRVQVHQWPFHRLQQAITTKAEQAGITIEQAVQQSAGSAQDQAKALVWQGYRDRQNKKSKLPDSTKQSYSKA